MPKNILTSDSFWQEWQGTPSSLLKPRGDLFTKDFIFSIDDSPEFHDPYSELNLFLCQKIKEEMQVCGNSKKWSIKLQEDLIQKITPDFRRRFPKLRLGISALRKTWERISFYIEQLQAQKEAIGADGKLNIPFFIRENLKQLVHFKPQSGLPAYHFAHQLAIKMSECIATIDGVRPNLEQLTRTIWAVQKHLVPPSSVSSIQSPYEEQDKIDKLIVKAILEATSQDPLLSQVDLENTVKDSIDALNELPSFQSIEAIACNISALLAEKLFQTNLFPAEQRKAAINFIARQIALCKKANPTATASERVRRIASLYSLASHLPQITDEEFKAAIFATYPILQESRPALSQAIYAFIAAESVLMKTDEFCHSKDYVADAILDAYRETKYLPKLDQEALELTIWKVVGETEGLLEKLPYRIGKRMDEEIATILIDNPGLSFSGIVHQTVQFFKRSKELAEQKKNCEIERKIHNWSIQGEMIYSFVRFDTDGPLLKMIIQEWKSEVAPEVFVSSIAAAYLKKFPQLSIYAGQLGQRIWILYKYAWYTHFSKPEETSFERFLKWQISYLTACNPEAGKETILILLEELCQKIVPMLPFDSKLAASLLSKE